MAANNIVYIDNQPIQLYKVSPTDSELELGMTAWEQTAYHKRLGNCGFIGPDYCHPVLNTDAMTFQFKLPTTGSNIIDAINDSFGVSGTNTSVSADQLIDAGVDFIVAGVQDGQLVVNFDFGTDPSAFVANVDSATTLDLTDDIFLNTPEDYGISPWKGTGNWKYNENTRKLYIDTVFLSEFFLEGVLTIDQVYKITIKVDSITSGSFDIFLGDNNIATINSVGTHVLYGQCQTTTDFKIVASSSFIGVISDSIGENIEILEVDTEFTISVFDLDGNYQNGFVWDATVNNAYTIGNCFVTKLWSTLNLDCGCYVVGVFVGDQICDQLILNGNFSSGVGWATDPGISISGGEAHFDTVTAGNALSNTLQCPIVNGKSYTLTYVISNNDGIKEGLYHLDVPAILSPRDASLEVGLQTVNFTAGSDQSYMAFVSDDDCTFNLDNVSLVCNDCELQPEDADGLSEAYCVCDAHDCTILLKYKNENNGFGLYYDESSEYNYFRLEASILSTPIKDNELIQFKNTLHFMNIPYWDGMKVFTLATDLLPAWVHNTITNALKHRILLIDGVRFIGIEEHSYNEEQTEVFGAVTRIALWNQQYLNNQY